MNICFVGCGNIAQAIIKGLLNGRMESLQICGVERSIKNQDWLKEKGLEVIELETLAQRNFDLIILAVKPKDAINVSRDIETRSPHTKIVTVVAGISANNYPQPQNVFRAMPNTATAFNKGTTAMYAQNPECTEFKNAKLLFKEIGTVLEVQKESDIHTFTSIIGSGQAFLFKVLDVYLKELAELMGDKEEAAETLKGFVSSLGDSFSKEPNFQSLIDQIKSPGGTTQAGLEFLDDKNIELILKGAFEAAKARSIEISNEQ